MWQFIISGYVPGTEIQITFEIFATFSAVTLSFFMFWLLLRQYLKHRHYYDKLINNDSDLFNEIAL